MAITFFGVATNPADNTNAVGPTIAITPVASMLDGDLVFVSVRYRASTATITVAETGGQNWSQVGAQYNATNICAAQFWCRFNGTWTADPSFTVTTGANNLDAQMLVFRPTSTTHTWSLESGPNSATFTAPATPFTVTRAGRTTAAASTVSIAAWHSVDDNSWGVLSGSGWSKTGLGAQYRNNGTADNSSTFAYNIQAAPATLPDVTQNQTALGGDAGSTSLTTFAETLVAVTLTSQASASAAGSLSRAFTEAAFLGAETTAAVGVVVALSDATTALVPVSGVAASAAAGMIDLGVPAEPVEVSTALGALIVSVVIVIAGAVSSTEAGEIQALGGEPGLVQLGSLSAASGAGSLATSIPVCGIAGVASGASAGLITADTGGVILASGAPGSIFASAQVGGAIVALTGGLLDSVEAGSVAENLSMVSPIAEIDGGSAAISVGVLLPPALIAVTSTLATAAVGALSTRVSIAVPIDGAQALSILGSLSGTTSGVGGAVPAAVASTAAAGTIEAAWTRRETPTGAEATAIAAVLAIEGGDSVSEEVFPTGAVASVAVGEITSGDARVSPVGVQAQARASEISLASAILLGALTADGIFVEPMFDGEVLVEPELSGEAYMEPLT